ncbi:MAG: hypothetical protein ACFFB3_13395 [Candidatus Hodarchaeota archaeon]
MTADDHLESLPKSFHILLNLDGTVRGSTRRQPNTTVCAVSAFLLSLAAIADCKFPDILHTQHMSFEDEFWALWTATWEYGLLSETMELRLTIPSLETAVTYMTKAVWDVTDVEPRDLFDFMGLGENPFYPNNDPEGVLFSEFLAGGRPYQKDLK